MFIFLRQANLARTAQEYLE